MSGFEIRPATLADAQMLSHIGVATFLESFLDLIEGQALMTHCSREHSTEKYATYLSKPETAAWLIVHPQTKAPAGYALNCAPDLPIDTSASDVELKRIYMLSRTHGTGAADMLMDAAIEHARNGNAERLLLGTYKDNDRATGFYIKHGFETIGTRQFNVGGKIFDDIVMARAL